MRRDVLELRAFYASARGRAAREMVGRKVAEAWGDPRGLDILGVGYPTPYLEQFRDRARRTVAMMPATQGVEVWPAVGRNLACIGHETALPLTNALFDRVLCVHALEEADDAVGLMSEVCRVLAPSGRVIVAVAARNGLWSNAEGTPFGHGRPWSRAQLEQVLRDAELEPSGWTRALYAPPFAWTARWAEGFEQIGAWLWPPLGGVILMEAVKQTFAVKPKGVRARARVFAPGTLVPVPPAPAGRSPDTAMQQDPLAAGPVSP
ncbi:MAG: methyltransferase domain-containing protein [Caulobacter sp.]|nr:methyltransferase domain-containing protein [Caulobacter sp.]